MLVCNLEQPCGDHADVVLAFARAMHESAAQVISPLGERLRIRVGIHTGPAVGNIVGRQRPRFCLFGQTVNTAARMESHGLPGMIQISGTTFDRLRQPETSNARYRGRIDVKGMGPVETFLVAGRDTPECFAALDNELEEAKKRSGGILNRISSVSTPGVRRRGSSSMAALVEDIAAMRAAETGSDLAPAKE
jgi:class 3 adenylate cyclase